MVGLVTALLAICVSGTAHAQYKCLLDGKTLYSERPCSARTETLPLPADTPVTEEERAEAKLRTLRQKKLLSEMEYRNQLDNLEAARESRRVRSIEATKQARCQGYLSDLKNAERDERLFSWGPYQDDARRRQKDAKDAHFSECWTRGRR